MLSSPLNFVQGTQYELSVDRDFYRSLQSNPKFSSHVWPDEIKVTHTHKSFHISDLPEPLHTFNLFVPVISLLSCFSPVLWAVCFSGCGSAQILFTGLNLQLLWKNPFHSSTMRDNRLNAISFLQL